MIPFQLDLYLRFGEGSLSLCIYSICLHTSLLNTYPWEYGQSHCGIWFSLCPYLFIRAILSWVSWGQALDYSSGDSLVNKNRHLLQEACSLVRKTEDKQIILHVCSWTVTDGETDGKGVGFWRGVPAQTLNRVRLFATSWTVAHQAPLSRGFPRQEYCSGLPSPSPWDLPDPGIEHRSPALAGRFFT